jgi:hypothetical protein
MNISMDIFMNLTDMNTDTPSIFMNIMDVVCVIDLFIVASGADIQGT